MKNNTKDLNYILNEAERIREIVSRKRITRHQLGIIERYIDSRTISDIRQGMKDDDFRDFMFKLRSFCMENPQLKEVYLRHLEKFFIIGSQELLNQNKEFDKNNHIDFLNRFLGCLDDKQIGQVLIEIFKNRKIKLADIESCSKYIEFFQRLQNNKKMQIYMIQEVLKSIQVHDNSTEFERFILKEYFSYNQLFNNNDIDIETRKKIHTIIL